jgi:hypothetical protein
VELTKSENIIGRRTSAKQGSTRWQMRRATSSGTRSAVTGAGPSREIECSIGRYPSTLLLRAQRGLDSASAMRTTVPSELSVIRTAQLWMSGSARCARKR